MTNQELNFFEPCACCGTKVDMKAEEKVVYCRSCDKLAGKNKSMTQMKQEIMTKIGVGRFTSNTNTVSRGELEKIYTWVMNQPVEEEMSK